MSAHAQTVANPLTSGHDFNMDGIREGAVPDGGESQDLDGVGF